MNMFESTHSHRRFANQRYFKFDSYGSLYANRKVFDSLVACYREIFAEPDIWQEDYSYAEVGAALQQLEGFACINICIDAVTSEVVGFCWAQLMAPDEVYETVRSVHYVDRIAPDDIEKNLRALVGIAPLIYLQDLGIKRSYRGKVHLGALVAPALEDVSCQSGTRKMFFWSVAETCVRKLADKANIPVGLTHHNMQFFVGELPCLKRYC